LRCDEAQVLRLDYLNQPAVTEAQRDQGPTVEYREAGIERTRDDVVRAEQHGAPRRVTTLIAPQGQPRRSGGPHDAEPETNGL